MNDSTFVTRVVLENYKSIATCDVGLGPLTFLVGPNGAGKSNFLDALRFVKDALRDSLDHALRNRGGINEVRRRSSGHPTHLGLRLEFRLRSGESGHYAFRIGALKQGKYEVQDEECVVKGPGSPSEIAHFRVQSGNVLVATSLGPPATADRLYLVNAAGLPKFRPVYEALSHMGFYNLNPNEIRRPQDPDPGDLLERDGWNLASVLARMAAHDEPSKERIEEYLAKVAPDVSGVDVKEIGTSWQTLEFRQMVAGASHPWRFVAANMSDGTLRALGVLIALFQSTNGEGSAVSLVGIEEPEAALHPTAAGVLRDTLRDASQFRQVVVTSHSPDLLADESLDSSSILAVVAESGVTIIGPIDDAGRSVIRERLFTAGELLRLNQLIPDHNVDKATSGHRPRLFDRERP